MIKSLPDISCERLIPFVAQRADHLKYRIVAHRVDLSALNILQTRTIAWGHTQVTFSVLGASHAVVLAQDDQYLTEMLTCAAPFYKRDFEKCKPYLISKRINAEGGSVKLVNRLWKCSSTLEYTPIPGFHDGLRADFEEVNRMDVCYPRGILYATPITRVGWRIEAAGTGEGPTATNIGVLADTFPSDNTTFPDVTTLSGILVVETVHSYPEEGRAARTLTRYEHVLPLRPTERIEVTR